MNIRSCILSVLFLLFIVNLSSVNSYLLSTNDNKFNHYGGVIDSGAIVVNYISNFKRGGDFTLSIIGSNFIQPFKVTFNKLNDTNLNCTLSIHSNTTITAPIYIQYDVIKCFIPILNHNISASSGIIIIIFNNTTTHSIQIPIINNDSNNNNDNHNKMNTVKFIVPCILFFLLLFIVIIIVIYTIIKKRTKRTLLKKQQQECDLDYFTITIK